MTDFDAFLNKKQSIEIKTDKEYMEEALLCAKSAKAKGDLPIGAVLAWPKRHLTEHDTTLTDVNPLETASVKVLRKAHDLMPYKVKGSVLYCTVEPDECSVLSAHQAGVKEIIFGAYDLKNGFVSKSKKSLNLESLDISYRGGLMGKECFSILPNDVKDYCSDNSDG